MAIKAELRPMAAPIKEGLGKRGPLSKGAKKKKKKKNLPTNRTTIQDSVASNVKCHHALQDLSFEFLL
jgi:hypothetical protein